MDWQPLRPGSRFALWHAEPAREEEQENWLITYLDMITLLLVMLVVMLAFAGKRVPPVEQQATGSAPASAQAAPAVEPPIQPFERTLPSPAQPDENLAKLAGDLGEDIEVLFNEGSVSFRISSELLFASGQAELADAGLDVMDRLLPTLAANNYRILIEGHTDDRPIQTERFPSNWELSASRASSVVRYLALGGIDPARMSATGYADTRPLDDNASDAGRARNRRVELVMQTTPEKP